MTDADSKDISMKGVFIETDMKIPIGTPCEIAIKVTGAYSKLSLRMKGRILLQDISGLLVVYDSMDFDSYFHLKNILTCNASDTIALEKESFSSEQYGHDPW